MNRRKFVIASMLGAAGLGAGSYLWPRRWNYIVIHHSGGNYGNIEFLQKVHRERQAADPVDAIPYHYIVGNGNGMGEGEVASDWRNDYNIWGAHLSANNVVKNFNGIGICLIGNFEENEISEKQFNAAVTLTRKVMQAYSIPIDNVTGHGHTPGENTKCPGKLFPMQKFMREL